MRWLLIAVAAVAMFALPASAASVDPRHFVLSQADVARGYLFDKDNSVLLTRAMFEGVRDESARVVLRSGFVNGYFARYLNSAPPHWRYVDSGAYVFRHSRGAKAFLPVLRRAGIAQGLGRARQTDLGDEAWRYTSSASETGTLVLWRYGRVVAWVGCRQMTRHRTLALAQARKQQLRITTKLG